MGLKVKLVVVTVSGSSPWPPGGSAQNLLRDGRFLDLTQGSEETGSANAGRGLTAVAPITAGEVVGVKGGHVVTTEVLRALPERLQNSEVQIADGLHLAAVADDEYEDVMLFLNHSCEPNVGFGGTVALVAMRDIATGEELTTDYALFDDHERRWAVRAAGPRAAAISTDGTGGGWT